MAINNWCAAKHEAINTNMDIAKNTFDSLIIFGFDYPTKLMELNGLPNKS